MYDTSAYWQAQLMNWGPKILIAVLILVATWAVARAVKWVIQRAIDRIADNPMIGRACDEVRPGYRKHAVGSHTLYYRIASVDVIDVVRILHQRMDVDRHLD